MFFLITLYIFKGKPIYLFKVEFICIIMNVCLKKKKIKKTVKNIVKR